MAESQSGDVRELVESPNLAFGENKEEEFPVNVLVKQPPVRIIKEFYRLSSPQLKK